MWWLAFIVNSACFAINGHFFLQAVKNSRTTPSWYYYMTLFFTIFCFTQLLFDVVTIL
jgi:hypothetical protein